MAASWMFAELGLPRGRGRMGGLAVAAESRSYSTVAATTVESRIGRLFRAVTEGYVDPAMRMAALDAVRKCRSRDWRCEIESVFREVKVSVPYRYDPRGLDIFASLPAALEGPGGDCGTHSVAHVTILGLLGYDVFALALAQHDEYRHVMAAVIAPIEARREKQRLVLLDSTEDWTGPWWRPASFREASLYRYDAEAWVSWHARGSHDSRLPPIGPASVFRGSLSVVV